MNPTSSSPGQPGLFVPVSVVIVGMLFILLVVGSPVEDPQAAPLQQDDATSTYTPPPSETPYEEPTETDTPEDEETEEPTATEEPTEEDQAEEPTQTEEPTEEEAEEPTDTAEPTEEEEPTETPERNTPTASATPIPKDDERDCFIGETVVIQPRIASELARPYTPLLLYFDGRVVGGGMSDVNGFYNLRLTIGEEEAGTSIEREEAVPQEYPVEVRVRDTRELVHELTCNLWAATPTPTIPVIPTRQDM